MGNCFIHTTTKAGRKYNLHLGVLIVLFFLVPSLAHASGCDGAGNCYVRSGATGTGTGTDWTNAYNDLPSSLSRGVTYWVAAGTYAPHVFNDPVSGTALITIKAPTATNHGTSTGWSSSYVGQALWQCTSACGPIWDVSQEDYIVFDGSYAHPLAAYPNLATSGYGFKLQTNGHGGNGNTGNGCTLCGIVQGGMGWNVNPASGTYNHDVTFKYVEIAGNHQTTDGGLADAAFDFEGGSYNLYFSHLYVHDSTWDYILRGNHQGQSTFGSGNNITVEYTYMTRDYSDQGSGTGPHGTPCSCSEGLTDFTWRYNIITDMVGTNMGLDTASGGDYNSGNGNGGPWYVYGNLWFADNPNWCAVGDGTLAIYDFSMTAGDVWFVNNTNANNGYPYCSVSGGVSGTDEVTYGIGIGYTTKLAGWHDQNNLWYAADLTDYNGSDIIQNGVTSGGTQGGGATFSTATIHSHNAYFNSPNTGANDNDTNKQVSSSNPFVSVSANNFNLASDTMPGVILASTGTYWNGSTNVANTFNVDMNGVTRGANGIWDRGAFQVGSSSTATLTSISVTPASQSINTSGTLQFTATGSYSDGTTKNLSSSVTWTSTSTGIATINASGLATGIAAGSTTITATSSSVSGSTSLTVKAAVTLQSIAVTPKSSTILAGGTQQFAATGTFSNGTTQNLTSSVTWSSSSTSTATVSTSGLAKGVAAGTATIKAVSGTISGSTGLTVQTVAPTLVSVALTPTSFSILTGSTQGMTLTGTYSDASTQNLTASATWSSSNTAVATVSSSGLVTGVARGSATIKAVYGLLSVSSTATVSASTLPNPQAWWKFNEGTGGTAADISGNSSTATLHGGANWTTGKVGNAVQSPASGGYLSTVAVNSSTTKAVTWTAWVNRTWANGQNTLIEASSDFNSSITGWGFFPDDSIDCGISNTLMTGVHGNAGYTLNCYKQPTSGVWHHIAAVYDKTKTGSSAVALYIDGVLQTPVLEWYSTTNTNAFGANNVYMFSRAGTGLFSVGKMQDLRIYNSALTASQITQSYQQGPIQ